MSLIPIIEKLKSAPARGNQPMLVELTGKDSVRIYPRSIHHLNQDYFLIARKSDNKKCLFILPAKGAVSAYSQFEGQNVEAYAFKCCPLTHHNAMALRELFDFTRPVLLGLENSYGLGDRLGLANPAHVRVIADTPLRPILAQQSIRELERTNRTAEEVLDAASWAVFQEGYQKGFGADADHLKTTEHIDRLMQAGFTFFTFDPSAYVVNEAATFSESELADRMRSLPWNVLADTPEGFLGRYDGKTFRLADDFEIRPTALEVRRGLVKYGGVIAHATTLYRHLETRYRGRLYEVELSVDETDSPTSPFEHFLVANELKRLAVKLVSLAPRFVGHFEKGIDYKGDLELFKTEYVKHVRIAEALGPYKISIHSGSDKFSVYEAIGSLKLGHVHVKTAGTSYLEALRTIAAKEPALFGEILDFGRSRYETDKATYHVSARLEQVPAASSCTPEQLLQLFDDDHTRQVLHVTFGSVLTLKDASGKLVFKDRIMRALEEHEETHYEFLRRHFRKHIKPFLR